MEVLKDKLNAFIDEINAEIDASPHGCTINDIAISFEKLFFSTIVHISFGEDVSDMQIEMDFRKSTTSSEFVRKTVPLAEGIHEIIEATFQLIPFKWLNPIYQAIRSVTGIKNLTGYQQTIAMNSQKVREAIRKYVN